MRELSIIDPEFAAGVSESFAKFNTADPDLRGAIALAESVTHNDFSTLEGSLSSLTNDEDRTKLISAMGWLRGDTNLAGVLELIRNERIKKQDTFMFYTAACANPKAREFMLDHLEFAVSQLRRVFVDTGTPSRVLEQMIPLLGIGREDRILARVNRLRSSDIETGIEKGIELLEVYSKFVRENGGEAGASFHG